MSPLAERIREAMEGMSPAELARAAKVTPGAVSQWLDGTIKSLKGETAAKIESATGYRAGWITTGKGPKKAFDSDLEAIFAISLRERGIQVEKLTSSDAQRIPYWLLHAFSHAREYVPDFIVHLPGRPPLFVEVKGGTDREHLNGARYERLQERHPGEFAVFYSNSSAPDFGLGEFLAEIEAPSGIGEARAPSYGLQPILSWQHEEELPPGEFVMVPRLDVHLSAGNGAGSTQVEIQFNEAQPQAFRADWIRQQHLKPKKLAAMTAHGDSMEHTIYDGDSLLIDTSQTEVADGRVYALWYEGGERVKRLFRLPGGGLRIKSDNSSYGAIELGPEYLGHVRVIGRVVHRSGRGGL